MKMNPVKQFEPVFNFLSQGFKVNLGKVNLSVTFWEVGAIVFLLFIMVLMMAQFRRHYVDWSFKGAAFGIFFGFLLALTLEGFLILKGNTLLTSILGWKDAPAPLQLALNLGKSRLVQVLGAQTQNSSAQDVLGTLQSLNPTDLQKVKTLICTP